MTKLEKKVVRETGLTFDGRPVIVDLEPPGYVGIRLKGTRTRWTIPAPLLAQLVIERHVEDALQQNRKRRRKAHRGLLKRA